MDAQQILGTVISPRIHFLEINDQWWWPQFLRERVQSSLTLLWRIQIPFIQPTSPAIAAANVLHSALRSRVSDYVYVDFASGSGGPTPIIEKELNFTLKKEGKTGVEFVLSDLKPHLSAWSSLAKRSHHLDYVRNGVDAAHAPEAKVLLQHVDGLDGTEKLMRLFSLAFHHFDDPLAGDILKDTVETSDGFAIFELQSRQLNSFILVSLIWPLLFLITPFYFWDDPITLFFTYIIPVIPFVVVFDGYISSLRVRTPEEVQMMLRSKTSSKEMAHWKFQSGEIMHTWPVGFMHWIICTRQD